MSTDAAGPSRRRWVQPIAVVTSTVVWIAGQAVVGLATAGTGLDLAWNAERPLPQDTVRRFTVLVTSFALLLVVGPAVITVLARAVGMRRTSIAYAALAALMLVPAVILIAFNTDFL